MIEHLAGREKALEPLGWTGPEAEWIALVCFHSGIFTRVQFCDYFNTNRKSALRFVQALLSRGEAVEPPAPIFFGGAKICRISSRRIYRALGIENARHRRQAAAAVTLRRLLSLDYVLEHPDLQWLPTEEEKVSRFDALGLDRGVLPYRLYSGSSGSRKRYFAHKLPIAVDGETATFAYADPGNKTDEGLRSWGATHSRLWDALRERNIHIRVAAIATTTEPFLRLQGVLKRWASNPSRRRAGNRSVKDVIALLNEALLEGDDAVLDQYGGPTKALRYCAELERMPEAEPGDGIRIDDYNMFHATRFDGAENGATGGAASAPEKA